MTPLYHLLVLCTGNSARSIMAEALINTLGEGCFRAYSAGSHPTGNVNPFAVEQVARLGYPIKRLRSKSWDEFAAPDAPSMEMILTVCDNAAGESCPVWPGQPISAHWSFADPAAVQGSEEIKRQAFAKTFEQIRQRMKRLVDLPVDQLDRGALREALQAIGQTPV